MNDSMDDIIERLLDRSIPLKHGQPIPITRKEYADLKLAVADRMGFEDCKISKIEILARHKLLIVDELVISHSSPCSGKSPAP